jgi:hypothetical protein
MSRQALQIILDGVASKKLDVESAITLIEAIQQHPTRTIRPTINTPNINTPNINPSDLTYPNPDWTYDPNRPGMPWYTVTSTGETASNNDTRDQNKPQKDIING